MRPKTPFPGAYSYPYRARGAVFSGNLGSRHPRMALKLSRQRLAVSIGENRLPSCSIK
jgi:hypothetical protein